MRPRRIAAPLFLLLAGCVGMPLTSQNPEPGAEPTSTAGLELPEDRAAEVCLATARELEKMGNEHEAIDQYEKARKHNPQLPQPTRRLAVLYDRQGDLDRALT